MERISYNNMLNLLSDRSRVRLTRQSLDVISKCLSTLGLTPDFILSRVGNKPERVILVAGTNGKGSVAAALSNFFVKKGFRTGLFTSPHLEKYNERIRYNGFPASDDLMVKTFSKVYPRIASLEPSYFEILTVMAVEIFFRGEDNPPVEWAVFEVGLGGKFDATNAIPHGTCVITKLGIDHVDYLGRTAVEIARNKLGILAQPNSHLIPEPRVIIAPPPEGTRLAFLEAQKATPATWIEAPFYGLSVQPDLPNPNSANAPLMLSPRFFLNTPWGKFENTLAGNRGAENASLAFATLRALGFSEVEILKTFESISWPGRMELVSLGPDHPPVYLSGDHNPQGIVSLLELLPFYPRRRLHVVLGISTTKNISEILRLISRLRPDCIFISSQDGELAGAIAYENSALSENGITIAGTFSSSESALDAAIAQSSPQDMVLITGSLYLVGRLRSHLKVLQRKES